MVTDKARNQIIDTALAILAEKERYTPLGGMPSVTVQEVYDQVPYHASRGDVNDVLLATFDQVIARDKVGNVFCTTVSYNLGPRK